MIAGQWARGARAGYAAPEACATHFHVSHVAAYGRRGNEAALPPHVAHAAGGDMHQVAYVLKLA